MSAASSLARERDSGGHLGRAAHAPRRHARQHRLDVLGEFQGPLGGARSRCDGVDGERGKIASGLDAVRVAASLLAGIQGGVGIMLANGDLSYLEAALAAGIDSLRQSD